MSERREINRAQFTRNRWLRAESRAITTIYQCSCSLFVCPVCSRHGLTVTPSFAGERSHTSVHRTAPTNRTTFSTVPDCSPRYHYLGLRLPVPRIAVFGTIVAPPFTFSSEILVQRALLRWYNVEFLGMDLTASKNARSSREGNIGAKNVENCHIGCWTFRKFGMCFVYILVQNFWCLM